MWIVDSFACLTPGTLDVHEVPRDLLDESMPAMNSLVSLWHRWLAPIAKGHVDDVKAFGVLGCRLGPRAPS